MVFYAGYMLEMKVGNDAQAPTSGIWVDLVWEEAQAWVFKKRFPK